MQVCRYAGMQVCRYAGMQVCRYAGMQVEPRRRSPSLSLPFKGCTGREADGLGAVYKSALLVTLKWHTKPLPAPVLDADRRGRSKELAWSHKTLLEAYWG